jgi:DNA replication protein DnaC
MENLGNLIDQAAKGLIHTGISRLKYMPYQMDIALSVINRIGKGINPEFIITGQIEETYKELIRFFHADPDFKGDLMKGLLLMGPSGTGKTLAMQIMNIYRQIDDIKFIMNGKTYRINYDIIDTTELINYFIESAFDGIDIYCRRIVICIDDIGTESDQVKHYGNCLDVVSHILSQRYAKRLLTFGTTNYPVKVLEQKYDDRIVSRMHALFNFIEMKGRDFRKT